MLQSTIYYSVCLFTACLLVLRSKHSNFGSSVFVRLHNWFVLIATFALEGAIFKIALKTSSKPKNAANSLIYLLIFTACLRKSKTSSKAPKQAVPYKSTTYSQANKQYKTSSNFLTLQINNLQTLKLQVPITPYSTQSNNVVNVLIKC